MKNKTNLMLVALLALTVTACTHQKVNVTEFDDKDKSCAALQSDIKDMEALEKDIDEKTGVSGRNVGMALLFWPGVVVNEINASDARDRASERREKLIALYSSKGCS